MREGTKGGLSVGGIIIGVLVLLVVVPFIIYGISLLTADTRGKTSVREKTVANGNYRIAQYDKFYNDCASVQGLEDQIDNMRQATGLPKDQKATNLLALRNQRNIAIRQYNIDSRKVGTQAQFKASDLPYQLDPRQEYTTC